jgi:hypothetical protein
VVALDGGKLEGDHLADEGVHNPVDGAHAASTQLCLHDVAVGEDVIGLQRSEVRFDGHGLLLRSVDERGPSRGLRIARRGLGFNGFRCAHQVCREIPDILIPDS